MHKKRIWINFLVAILIAPYRLTPSLLASTQDALPLPEFFGVYAVHNGKLTELARHPQSGTLNSPVGGADLLKRLSGIEFRDGNLQFIIFQRAAAYLNKVPAARIGRVRDEVELDVTTRNPKSRKTISIAAWHIDKRGLLLRVAPIPQNPTMMIRAVPEAPLAPGLWAIKIGETVYDFGIGQDPSAQADCVDRHVHIINTIYPPCTEKDPIP